MGSECIYERRALTIFTRCCCALPPAASAAAFQSRYTPENSMIIDCDTHFMPRDAFDRVSGALASQRPVLKVDENGLYVTMDFPGRPKPLPEATPLPPPGTGSDYPGMIDMEARLRDYEEMGIER